MEKNRATGVGPIVRVGAIAEAVVAAIRELSPQVEIVNRGAYVRVHAPQRCELHRNLVEKYLGRRFVIPEDLELIMLAFSGKMQITADSVVWALS